MKENSFCENGDAVWQLHDESNMLREHDACYGDYYGYIPPMSVILRCERFLVNRIYFCAQYRAGGIAAHKQTTIVTRAFNNCTGMHL